MGAGNLYRYFYKEDIIIYFLLMTLFFGVAIYQFQHNDTGQFLCIYQYDKLRMKIPLDEDKIFSYKDKTIVIENGAVRIVKSECLHQYCVRHKAIKNVGECNLCVPTGILLKIEGKKKGKAIDALSH